MQPTSTEHQFTPPPWELHADGSTWQVTDTDNKPICLVRHGVTDETRQWANACLIAAAPELLIAARNYLVGLEQNAREIFGDEHVEMMDKLSKYDETRHLYRAKEALEVAVARAEGRAS